MTVAVPANTGNARSSTITIQGGGITRTISVNQEATVKWTLTITGLESGADYYLFNGAGGIPKGSNSTYDSIRRNSTYTITWGKDSPISVNDPTKTSRPASTTISVGDMISIYTYLNGIWTNWGIKKLEANDQTWRI